MEGLFRYKIFGIFFILLTVTSTIYNTINVQAIDSKEKKERTVSPKFNPTGFYIFAGNKPRNFSEFEALDLATAETATRPDGSLYWVSTPPKGAIVVRGKPRFYPLEKTVLNGTNLTFKTKNIQGISYEFKGRFLKTGVFYDLDPTTPVLTGRLTRLKNGKVTAATNVNWLWYRGD